MKRSLISILFAMLLLPSSFGYEWGLSLVNSTEFKGQEFDSLKLNQNDSLSLWTKIPFNKNNSSYLVGDVSYHFKYEDAGNNPVGLQNIVNLNMFKFVSEISFNNVNKFFIMAGRFPLVDSSRKVFAQSSDGLYLKYAGVFTNISLYGGYTGLLNSKEVTVLTPSETKYKEASNDFYTLAPKYVPVSVMFNFPSLFANQQLNIQGWGFLDLNGDNFNRYYANIELDGYLAGVLCLISESLINNSQFNILAFVIDEMAYHVARFIENVLLNGGGSVEGLSTLTNSMTAASANAITSDEVIQLQARVKDIYQDPALWIMSVNTRTALRLLKDEVGRYMLQDDITAPFGKILLGKPVYVSDNMNDMSAGKTTIYYGDMSGLATKFSETMSVKVLREKYATQHAVGVVGWLEFDSKVENAQKITKLVMAGTPVSA